MCRRDIQIKSLLPSSTLSNDAYLRNREHAWQFVLQNNRENKKGGGERAPRRDLRFYDQHTCGPKQRGGKSSKKREGGREPASKGACGGGRDCTMPLNPPAPPVLKSCCKLLSLMCSPRLLVVLPPLPPPASGSPPCDLSWSCAGTDVERMIEIGLLTVRRTTPGQSRFRR